MSTFKTKIEAERFIKKRKKGFDKLIKQSKSKKDITTKNDLKAIKERVKFLSDAKKDLKIRKRIFSNKSVLYFID